MSKTRAILDAEGIDPERVRFTEFVTVMLGKFVGELNGLSGFAERLGPISRDKREALGTDVNAKLFDALRTGANG